MRALCESFFTSVPYDWYRKNEIARYQGYYASVCYAHFAALGLDVTVEDSTSRGRLNMSARFNHQIYLFDFKVVELAPEGTAMEQLRARYYPDKYRALGQRIHLIAVQFSREDKTIAAFEEGPA